MEQKVTYINRIDLERLVERFGTSKKYERLENGEAVVIDGKVVQLSKFNGASPLHDKK